MIAALVGAPFTPSAAQVVDPASVGLGVVPDIPPVLTVGDTSQPGAIRIVNISGPGVGPVTLSNITLFPVCGDQAPGCNLPENGVFDLSATGIGRAGTACAGIPFVISGPAANGSYQFIPATPVVLALPNNTNDLDACFIDYTFDVLRAPTVDAGVGPGLQIGQFASANGTALTTSLPGAPELRFGSGAGTVIATILLASPTINTVATPAVTLSQPISDTATVTGPVAGPPVTGTVTFTLFGPDNPTCTGVPLMTSTTGLNAGPAGAPNDATATSAPFTPTAPGAYNWVAVYNGDANYAPVTSPCGAPNETSLVNRPAASINTVATPSTTVPGTISDTANVTGLTAGVAPPTGTVTFTLFNNATCTGAPVFTSPDRPLVNGVATSAAFAAPAGTYNWVATYSGDAIYLPVSAACGAPNETSTVLRAQPAINTQATPTAAVNTPIQDIATLSGTVAPPGSTVTGTITFNLYGPNDLICAGPSVFTSIVPVTGNGQYTSAPFTPNMPGTYQWVASYSGDANNLPVTAPCGAPNETTRVLGPPAIQVVKTATPETRLEPGGAFTFNVVVTNTGPNALTISSLIDSIHGNLATQGTCTTAIGTSLAADPDGAGPGIGGTYPCSFTANFFGEAGDSETDVVTVVGIDELGQQATDDDDATVNITDVLPNIQVVKDATPESLPEPGGTFTFTVTVTNTSIEPVTITSLEDDVYPNIDTLGTCTDAVGTELAANGGTYTCEFPGLFTGSAPDSQTDTVTVVGVDNDGTEVTDEDDATVTLTNVVPTVQVVKTATPESRPAPGGAFTFNVVVTNTSDEVVTITTLTDDIYGNIATQGTCTTAIGTVLDPDESYSCSFTGNFTGTSGSQTDIVTVVVVDETGTPATDTDDATVTITPALTVLGQDLNNVATSTPTNNPTSRVTPASTTGNGTLPKTGAGVVDLLLVSTGFLLLGGLFLLTANHWTPSVQAAPLFGPTGVVSGRIRGFRHRRRAT